VCFCTQPRISAIFSDFHYEIPNFAENREIAEKPWVRKIHELSFYDDQMSHCPDKYPGQCFVGFLFLEPGNEICNDLQDHFVLSAIFSDFQRFWIKFHFGSKKNTKERSSMPNGVHTFHH
tara:strand:- start:256 stop:615 length:360 start_codon:yes stop_codon:yes gene_type:complete